jgi:AraC-like DNA-binding protein
MQRIAGTHFHFNAELFMQVGGFTEFSFPREKIRLLAGETLLVPTGLPHGERARDSKSDFLTVVVMLWPDTVSFHAGVKDRHGRLSGRGLKYFKTDKGPQIERYFNEISDFYHSGRNAKEAPDIILAIRGLFQAALTGLLSILKKNATLRRPAEHPKVSECRKYILSHIYEPALSVKKLAGKIQCSPDYLSHLFATETGERLCDFIHHERIALAKRYLQNEVLNVKETAWACGFTDQGYFARLFKRLAGVTPREFQKRHKRQISGAWMPTPVRGEDLLKFYAGQP